MLGNGHAKSFVSLDGNQSSFQYLSFNVKPNHDEKLRIWFIIIRQEPGVELTHKNMIKKKKPKTRIFTLEGYIRKLISLFVLFKKKIKNRNTSDILDFYLI